MRDRVVKFWSPLLVPFYEETAQVYTGEKIHRNNTIFTFKINI